MHGFWKRKLPAFLLALVLVTSLIPAAGAVVKDHEHTPGKMDYNTLEHWVTCTDLECDYRESVGSHIFGDWEEQDSSNHVRECTVCGYKSQPEPHELKLVDRLSKEPTCYQSGLRVYVCACGYGKEDTIPATNDHHYTTGSTWSKDSTQHWHACTTQGCTATSGKEAHKYISGVYTSSASQHWQVCSVCGGDSAKTNHTDANNDGVCDVCRYVVSTARPITVTFMNGSTTFNTQSINTNGKPSNPGTPTYFTSNSGCTYTFKGWTTTNPGSKAIYTNQSLTNVASVGVSGNTTYYAVYTLTATSQNVTVSAGNSNGTVIGSSIVNELNSRFSSLAGQNSFNSVSFGSSNGRGTLYANSNRNGLSYNYSYSPSAVSSFYFVPGSSNGYTITYTAVDNWSNKISGTITVNNSNTAANGTITYYVAPGGTVDFKSVNFADAYRNLSGDTSTLRWVSFSAPNRYGDLGYLYSGSLTLDRSRLINNDYYYSSSSYGQYALSSLNFKAASNARNGDTVSIPFRAYYNNSTYYDGTVKIVISQNGGDGVVTYRVAPGQSIRFDRTDFNNAYQNLTDTSRTIRYVALNAPNAYTSFSGKIYASGHSDFTASELTYDRTLFYYNSKSYGDYALDDLLFQANSGARDGDTLTMDFRAYYSRDDYATGTLKIVIDKNGSDDTVTATAAPGGTVRLDRDDFNDVYQLLANSRRDVSYVSFEAPSSYDSFAGKLYAGNTALTRTDLRHNGIWFYYNSKDASGRDYAIEDLTFRADTSARNNASLNIPFRAYYSSGDYVDGILKLSVNSSTGSQVSYTVPVNGSVSLRASDFNDAYRSMSGNSNRTIAYIAFDAPNAYASFNGGLYTGSSGNPFNRTELAYSRTLFYYSNSRYGDYSIDSLTFKANSSARNGDTLSIPFRAYYSDSDYEEGTMKITVGNAATSAGNIEMTVTPGKTVNFDRAKFNDLFQKSYRSDSVSYVVFRAPSETEYPSSAGTFYRGYGTSYSATFTRNALADPRFYYDSRDAGVRDYAINDLTFAAASNFTGKVTLQFTAYGSGSNSITGSVIITPVSGTAASNIGGSIRYNVTTGNNVQINANDFAKFYKAAYSTDTLQYVTFSGVPSVGALYYNFYSASSFGSKAREQISSANYASRSFYRSPTSASQYALTELTYVPSGSNYCASIPFTAHGTSGKTLTGSVLISVTSKAVSEVYGVTPKGVTVSFPASAIYTAVSNATGTALTGIQLLKLPAAAVGTVYSGTGATPANTTTIYPYSGGSEQMGQLRFAPASTYTGPVEIPYVALGANNNPIAAGTFSLGVLNAKKDFGDVTASTWCYKYITELADANVIDGYPNGTFKPDSTISYGAALKLVMLAAGYPEQAPTVKGSTFSGYLSRARADGIITRSNVDLTKPITRLQVAQLAAGSLKLDINNLSSVKPFTDTNDVYVQALNAAGIVEGYFSNGTSTYKPGNTLTRGQVSAIVWRMRNYRQGR